MHDIEHAIVLQPSLNTRLSRPYSRGSPQHTWNSVTAAPSIGGRGNSVCLLWWFQALSTWWGTDGGATTPGNPEINPVNHKRSWFEWIQFKVGQYVYVSVFLKYTAPNHSSAVNYYFSHFLRFLIWDNKETKRKKNPAEILFPEKLLSWENVQKESDILIF